MKRLIKILMIILIALNSVQAQQNVFIMIDVSKSGDNNIKQGEGKDLIKDIITGQFNLSRYSNWLNINPNNGQIDDSQLKSIISGTGHSLIGNNSTAGIVQIGEYRRHLTTFQKRTVSNNSQFVNFYNSAYPHNTWSDDWTIINLVQAWIAVQAKKDGLDNYYLFQLSDNQSDLGDIGSTTFTDEEDKLIAAYGSSAAPKERILTLSKTNSAGTKKMFLTIWKITNLQQSTVIPGTTKQSKATITIQSYSDGTKKNPSHVSENKIQLSWTCNGCPPNPVFTYKIKGLGSNNDYKLKKSTSNSYIDVELEDGTYYIIVTGERNNEELKYKPDRTYIKVDSTNWFQDSWGWFLFIIVLAVAGYYYWKKSREPQKRRSNTLKNNNEGFSI